MTARYVLGIDLGTTNSVIAYTPLDVEQPAVQLLPIPQLVAAGTVESLGSLASFLYLAREHEIGQGVFDLSWAAGRDFAVGELARRQSAEVAERTVGAAKSWLCHARVDRRGEILPWNAPAGVPKISPVTATRRYLEHLIATWEQAFPDVPLADQFIVLTVPASFDAAARDLTREAALAAGLPGSLLLLEEPQAAVYAWLDSLGNRWRRALKLDDMLLVCDVGGGTSDFTLVKVAEEKGELILQREAVGNHLLVGGDNMDLALAYQAAETFGNKGVKLDPWQSVSLWHACRAAKETLLSADGPNAHTISVLGRGTKLIGGTVSIEMKRKQALEVLVEGFFPPCEIGERPVRRRASGFQDIGLPFEQDTAVTRHLAAFLVDHGAGQGGGRFSRPTCCSTVVSSRPRRCRTGCWTSWASGPAARNPDFWKASRTWTTRLLAERRTMAGPKNAAACESAAARRGLTTSASRPPDWPSPALRGRCGHCASRRWVWRKATRPMCRRRRSVWSLANRPISVSSVPRRANRTGQGRCCLSGPTTNSPKPIRWKPPWTRTKRSRNRTCRSSSSPASPS